jgi:hypothetical protein
VDITVVAGVDGTSRIAVIVVSSQGDSCVVVTHFANAAISANDLEQYAEQIGAASVALA